MVIPWMLVLQSVPWTDVIRNAPKVADGAKKLWNAVSGRPVKLQSPPDASAPIASLEMQAIAALEAAVSELHSQMLASSELIKALAEQNGQLVARIEANRVRLLWLSLALAATAMAAVASLVLMLQRYA